MEGTGKNNDLNFTEYLNDSDMEADGEHLDEDGSEEGEFRKKGKGMVDEGKKDEVQGKRTKQEEDTDVDNQYTPHNDDNTINEPNFIWNKNKYTSWGKCYFKALEDDKVFGNGRNISHPIYWKKDGFILKGHPSDGQNRVYIPDS